MVISRIVPKLPFGHAIEDETPVSCIINHMRTRYKIIDNEGIYFITSTIVEWIPVFTTQKYSDIIIQSIKYCKEHKGLKLYAYVILDNHFHLVASAPELSSVVASLKQFTAREIIAQLE
ncbi:MAG: transposase [Candidatus Anammoxibacter sp.]